jgi:hypothetical protein
MGRVSGLMTGFPAKLNALKIDYFLILFLQ